MSETYTIREKRNCQFDDRANTREVITSRGTIMCDAIYKENAAKIAYALNLLDK